jgi:hypothetical protein
MLTMTSFPLHALRLLLILCCSGSDALADALKVAVFDVDATPPLGMMMAYDPAKGQDPLALRARDQRAARSL